MVDEEVANGGRAVKLDRVNNNVSNSSRAVARALPVAEDGARTHLECEKEVRENCTGKGSE